MCRVQRELKVELLSPEDRAVSSLLKQEHLRFVQGERNAVQTKELDWLNLERGERLDVSFPQGILFEWRYSSPPERDLAAYLYLSDHKDFTHATVIAVDGESCYLDNFMLNTNYYWKIGILHMGELVSESEVHMFTTSSQPPRWIRVPDLTNVRDIGGWSTVNGRRVRQNMMYRGSEKDFHHNITKEGIRILCDHLKVRTDLDLRGEAVGKIERSALGDGVALRLIPALAYADFFKADQEDTARRIFSLFAESDNYPFYVHCWGGADRTGTVILLLNALLGVSDEDLMLDYELTSFSVWGDRDRSSDWFKGLLTALDRYGPGSLAQKAERYLLLIGITREQIAAIRSILLV